MRARMKNNQGFSFIELMVVLVILGIMATMIVPRIIGRPEEARRVKARVDIQTLETALRLYRLDNGEYPGTEQGLAALIAPPESGRLAKAWRDGGYLEKNVIPRDPWGNEYVYLCPGAHGEFDLFSYGFDGEPGGEGKNADITNWQVEQ